MSQPLLKVENLQQFFPISRTYTVKAVNGVSFEIYPGETYGLVGESGSGKTTIGRSIIRLYNPTGGKLTFNGRDITGKMDNATRSMLRKEMQMIFQDPMASLNPRKKVADIIGEGLDIHHRASSRTIGRSKSAKCSRKWASAPSTPPAIRTSFPAASASVWASPGR
jgi:oligopeptide transport system ATP-binding protein